MAITFDAIFDPIFPDLGKIYLGCYERKSSNQIPTFP